MKRLKIAAPLMALATPTVARATTLQCEMIDVDSNTPLSLNIEFGIFWGATVTLFIPGHTPASMDAESSTSQWAYNLTVSKDGSKMLVAQIDRSTGAAAHSYQSALWRTAKGTCQPAITTSPPRQKCERHDGTGLPHRPYGWAPPPIIG
jgi:hypothetical protein